jgi:hypothetical protein
VRESLDPTFIVSSVRGTVLVGLVIIRAIVVIVPFIASFTLDAVSFLALVFYPVACISVADNITEISIVPISVMPLRESYAAG